MVWVIISVDKRQAFHSRYSSQSLTICCVGIDNTHPNRFHGILDKALRVDDEPTHWKHYFGGAYTIEQRFGVRELGGLPIVIG